MGNGMNSAGADPYIPIGALHPEKSFSPSLTSIRL